MNEYYVAMQGQKRSTYSFGMRVEAEDWNAAALRGKKLAEDQGYTDVVVKSVKRLPR